MKWLKPVGSLRPRLREAMLKTINRLRLLWEAEPPCGDQPDLFVGSDTEASARRRWRERSAAAICAGCPVRESCLAYALAAREEHGVWGGYSPEERAALLAQGEAA
jgi:WhiB family redox-sensing transcriptional regulator